MRCAGEWLQLGPPSAEQDVAALLDNLGVLCDVLAACNLAAGLGILQI